MAARNRVNPFSEIVALPARGLLMGNRGCLHVAGEICRNHSGRRWIICTTDYNGRRLDQWAEGRYTVLFFHDEAVALAAGHRPCARCQRDQYDSYVDCWASAFGDRPSADLIDFRLHAERVLDDRQRTTTVPWPALPRGAFAIVDDSPVLVLDDCVVPWTGVAYGPASPRPAAGPVTVLTPPATLGVLAAGYKPLIAPIPTGATA